MSHEKIRETFKWGQNYNKDSTRLEETKFRCLKDLSDNHIIGILTYFTKNFLYRLNTISTGATPNAHIKQWLETHMMFLNELNYRYDNNIYIRDYEN